ncbi:MAG: hypothetical protein LBQ97_06935 [Fusobacteriaceae bacterium]|jgi:hypothetical protein|nr:hypothetical protein [Fusobacteriaceae bacterium]
MKKNKILTIGILFGLLVFLNGFSKIGTKIDFAVKNPLKAVSAAAQAATAAEAGEETPLGAYAGLIRHLQDATDFPEDASEDKATILTGHSHVGVYVPDEAEGEYALNHDHSLKAGDKLARLQGWVYSGIGEVAGNGFVATDRLVKELTIK